MAYDPYGRTTLVSGSNLATFQYAGYYAHQPSGLEMTLFRSTYDPNTGRWLNRDPIGEKGGLNMYEYGSNAPVDVTDPLGLAPGDPSPAPQPAGHCECMPFALTVAINVLDPNANADPATIEKALQAALNDPAHNWNNTGINPHDPTVRDAINQVLAKYGLTMGPNVNITLPPGGPAGIIIVPDPDPKHPGGGHAILVIRGWICDSHYDPDKGGIINGDPKIDPKNQGGMYNIGPIQQRP
jgi:RHS repeat-associated protein